MALLKKYHPDNYTDQDDKKVARKINTIINVAYDEVLADNPNTTLSDYDSSTSTQQPRPEFRKYNDILNIIDKADFDTIMDFIEKKKYSKDSLDQSLLWLSQATRINSSWSMMGESLDNNLNAQQIFELIQACVQAGANVNARKYVNSLDYKDYTPLFCIFWHIGNELTETGTNAVGMKSNNQPNYLYLTIKYLLDQGADINNITISHKRLSQFSSKSTEVPMGALEWVARYSRYNQPLLIDMLIQHGAQITPEIVTAARKKNTYNADILKSYVSKTDPRYWFK